MPGANDRLRLRIIGMVVAILVVGFVATDVLSYLDAVGVLKTTVLHQELPLTGSNIYSEVQADLVRPVAISSQMATDTFVREWLVDGEKDFRQITRYLDAIRKKYGVFTSYLISNRTREYYHFNGPLRKVDPKSADDVWFFRCEKMAANYEINIDYDLASHRTVTIFVNYKVLDASGEFLGVTGVGLNLGSVQRIVERYRNDFQRNVYFINKAGDITVGSQDLGGKARNIHRLPGIDAIANKILAVNEGQFEYARGGEKYLLETRLVPELNWYIMVEQRQSAVTRSLWFSFLRNLGLGLIIIFLTTVMVAYAISVYHAKLDAMASTDKLTGLVNRQAFDATLERLLESRRRGARQFSLILFDIDHFKQINDTWGHLRGDEVIRSVAQAAARRLRQTDVICRWGGEELIVLASACALDDARALAEDLRATIAKTTVFAPDNGTRVTISAGVTAYQPGDSVNAILGRVDHALYQAKRGGRNCVFACEAGTAIALEHAAERREKNVEA